ncbi:DNA repair protein RAD5 [Mycena indigotica]|uniref:DNA repair protein RAD5 n=1 Tax=Mycena indigotica TaxID=2126181 RepID=A0A8H6VT85_9AGAR|nr:DNA repair protein RAD5 [Mycena indigotica]KAF7291121.1 DNA repair protein RAD5 [Mycena indigotica]
MPRTSAPLIKPEPPPSWLDASEEIPLPDQAPSRTKEEAKNDLRKLLDSGAFNCSFTGDQSTLPGFKDGVRLKPHQVKGRLWMRQRENPPEKFGGLLCDDMGVGKTLQTIACILDRLPTKEEAAQGWSHSTLIVAPLAVLEHWATEIQTKTNGLRVIKYHDSTRGRLSLAKADVVVTTYGIVRSEHTREKPTALFSTKWLRVVLDEAHTIKNSKTETAKACFSLQARFRWCLTATPMQNAVEDFYSLFHFLRIKPVNDWTRFQSEISKPIDKGNGNAGLAMKRLQVVLKHVLLRRLKTQLDELKLPTRTVTLVSCHFSDDELAFYKALKAYSNTIVKRIMKNSDLHGGTKYINILVMLLRLRQACDHPRLVLEDYKEALEELDSEESVMPKVFLDGDKDTDDESADQENKCGTCAIRLTRKNMAGKDWPGTCINCAALQVQAENLSSPFRASTKVNQILRLLKKIACLGGNQKTVIFSQWTSFLDLLEPFLLAMNIRFTRYDGKLGTNERAAALKEIADDARVTVILVSLKAGGQGLNLTCCNHVILVDMWWNPAVEEQAFDRTHRVGQKRDVHIYKLRVEETVEDRILELQDRKRRVTNMALSQSREETDVRLNLEELLNLFK